MKRGKKREYLLTIGSSAHTYGGSNILKALKVLVSDKFIRSVRDSKNSVLTAIPLYKRNLLDLK